MSVNVRCSFCGREFEVSKEAADIANYGFQANFIFTHKPTGIDVQVGYATFPAKGEMCPACSLKAVKQLIEHDEKMEDLLMKGNYTK